MRYNLRSGRTAWSRSALCVTLWLAHAALTVACELPATIGVAAPEAPVSDGAPAVSGPDADGPGGAPPASSDGGAQPEQAGREPLEGLRALRVDPAELTVVVQGGAAVNQPPRFTATGTFDDGERDVSDLVTWRVLDGRLGEVVDGVFSSAGLGGHGRIVAQSGDLRARADVTVRVETTREAPDVPADPASLFGPASDDVQDPARLQLVYPSDETMLPQNLERVTHQWDATSALDLFEVRFESDVLDLRVYTTARDWRPDPATWRLLAESHHGASVSMRVRGLASRAPGRVFTSRTITLHYSRADVIGALYYWSSLAAGVMKASLSAPRATKFFPKPGAPDADTCVSCHTVSRDGRRMAVGYDGERLRQVNVDEQRVELPADPRRDGDDFGWATYNPGATRLLYAHKGVLTLRDAASGALLASPTLGKDLWATHPDWAPDGRSVAVAFTRGRKAPKNKDVKSSGIARLPVRADGSFGPLEVLLESAGRDDTLVFPSYSPDSRWIAFARARGGSKDNPSAELWLIPAQGGRAVPLTRLNRRVGARDGVTGVGNSMPTWAPATGEDGVFWLAFSSLRDYGHTLTGQERDQLWAAAVEPSALAAGQDPSFAAFWLPFQQLEEGNHRAFWVLDASQDCPSTQELCDGLDNDCDGIVDNDCCTPEPELCGDELDNDCDGAVDEGCGCADRELCDNGVDDDCDQLVDGADEDCTII